MKHLRIFLYIIVFSSIILSFGACSDPIFHKISSAIPRVEPRIKGSPTNFVMFDNRMFVASGRKLYSYRAGSDDTKGRWTNESLSDDLSGKNFIGLAATEDYLYALVFEDREKSLVRQVFRGDKDRDKDRNWQLMSVAGLGEYNVKQTIFSANNVIYIGSNKENTNEHAVFSINFIGTNGTGTAVFTGRDNAMLVGAAYNGSTTFLCTRNGIFTNTSAPISGSELNFVGMIALLDNTIMAINRNGNLYEVTTSGVERRASFDDGQWATGAIGIWHDASTSRNLLLVGRQDREYTTTTGYAYGYLELLLDETGGLIFVENDKGELTHTIKYKRPGENNPTTVDNSDSYDNSLGTIPINHIFQAPDEILFASTQKNGVWSVRMRFVEVRQKSERIWNAEE